MHKKAFTWICVSLVFFTVELITPARGSRSTNTKVVSIPIKSGLLLTRSDSSGERMRGRFGSIRGIDPIRSKLVDGTLREFYPQEGESPGGQDNLKWRCIELDDTSMAPPRTN
jgi:hypothetical protein